MQELYLQIYFYRTISLWFCIVSCVTWFILFCVATVAVDVPVEDAVVADDDKLPTDGRDSGIGQSTTSSSIPSVVIDHLSSGAPSRVQSGLAKLPDQGINIRMMIGTMIRLCYPYY